MRRSIVIVLVAGLVLALTHGSWGARREMSSVTGVPARASSTAAEIEKEKAPKASPPSSVDHDARSIAVLTLLLLGGPESARPLMSSD